MTKLPVISGKKLIKVLSKLGYYVRDQKGSHVLFTASDKETFDGTHP